jgi:hypothetical protein
MTIRYGAPASPTPIAQRHSHTTAVDEAAGVGKSVLHPVDIETIAKRDDFPASEA